jgi:hypothetical protein
METPVINRRSVQKMSSIFSLKKKKLSLDENSFDFQTNCHTPAKKPRMDRQQSLTFIADLASTSTPTQNKDKPITSTPKNDSHNPAKYHPTQTIRNKRTKKQPQYKLRATKPLKTLDLSTQFTLLQENYILNHIHHSTKKVVSVLSCSNCQQQCNTCTGVKTISYNFLNFDHSTPCRQRRDLAVKEKRSTRNNAKKVKVDEVRKYLKKQGTHSARTAQKPVSKIGISLEDLLYTPRKLLRSDSFKSSNAVKSSTRLSRVVVAASTPTVNLGSKVYFL